MCLGLRAARRRTWRRTWPTSCMTLMSCPGEKRLGLNFISRRQRKYLFDISHIYALNTSHFSSSSLNPYNNIYVQDKLDDWQPEVPVPRPKHRPHLGHSHPDPNINQTKGRYLEQRQAPLPHPRHNKDLLSLKAFCFICWVNSSKPN